jgi:hypothetical protein
MVDKEKPKVELLEYLKNLKGTKAGKQLKEMVEGSIDLADKTNESEFKMDRFAELFKHVVEQDEEKSILMTLEIISQGLANGSLSAVGPDTFKSGPGEGNSKPSRDPNAEPRRLLDSIVDVVCYCQKIATEDVQFKVCKVLLEIFTDVFLTVSSESLKTMFSTLCNIMSSRHT